MGIVCFTSHIPYDAGVFVRFAFASAFNPANECARHGWLFSPLLLRHLQSPSLRFAPFVTIHKPHLYLIMYVMDDDSTAAAVFFLAISLVFFPSLFQNS